MSTVTQSPADVTTTPRRKLLSGGKRVAIVPSPTPVASSEQQVNLPSIDAPSVTSGESPAPVPSVTEAPVVDPPVADAQVQSLSNDRLDASSSSSSSSAASSGKKVPGTHVIEKKNSTPSIKKVTDPKSPKSKKAPLDQAKSRRNARAKRARDGDEDSAWMTLPIQRVFSRLYAENPAFSALAKTSKFSLGKEAARKLSHIIHGCHENICEKYATGLRMWNRRQLRARPAVTVWNMIMDPELSLYCRNKAAKSIETFALRSKKVATT